MGQKGLRLKGTGLCLASNTPCVPPHSLTEDVGSPPEMFIGDKICLGSTGAPRWEPGSKAWAQAGCAVPLL